MAHQLTSNTTKLEELKAKVQALPDGKKIQESKTVTPSTSSQTVTPDSGYDGLAGVTVNAMPSGSVGNPSISVSSTGLITATAAVDAGYVDGTDKTGTKQLTVQGAQTITPGTADKSIASGRYLTGTQTIKGDANLVAGNIKSGVSIFGVAGTHEGGEDVSAETAEYTGLLDDLETAIDALPEAGSGGGGGGVETCTVEFAVINYASDNLCYLYYMKPDLSIGYTAHQPDLSNPYATTSITVLKNSIACLMCEDLDVFSLSLAVNGGVELIENTFGDTNLFVIRDSGTIMGSNA